MNELLKTVRPHPAFVPRPRVDNLRKLREVETSSEETAILQRAFMAEIGRIVQPHPDLVPRAPRRNLRKVEPQEGVANLRRTLVGEIRRTVPLQTEEGSPSAPESQQKLPLNYHQLHVAVMAHRQVYNL